MTNGLLPPVATEPSKLPVMGRPLASINSRLASSILLALLLFVAVDLSLRLMPRDPMATPEKSTIHWAVSEYRRHSTPPDVCLLGSSLMIAAQNDTDATYFRRQFDALGHYHSDYLEKRLAELSGRKMTTGSFVIGGQMASDALAIFRTLLCNKASQQIVVWGIAPRDFVDATFGNPSDSETVRFLSRFPNDRQLTSTVRQSKKTFWQSINDTMENASATYAQRLQIRSIYQQCVERALSPFVPDIEKLRCPNWLLHDAAVVMPEDNRPGQWIVRPMEAKGNENRDNTVEYEKRYRPFNAAKFSAQVDYYRQLLQEAESKNIRVLVVNMPLRQDNLALLPPGVYQKYLGAVSSVAHENRTAFLDLNDSRFTAKDFWDPVHLNGYGGMKFMDLVAKTIEGNKWLDTAETNGGTAQAP